MHRLLVPSSEIAMPSPSLPATAKAHLRVLRPKKGEPIELFDGAGRTRECIFDAGNVVPVGDVATEERPFGEIWMFACLTKGPRWEWTIEKLTELGVSRIVPVLSKRSIVRLAGKEREAKRLRWQKIAEEAARQSNAAYLPEIADPVPFAEAASEAKSKTICFAAAIADPPHPPAAAALASANANGGGAKPWSFFIGPEGDFSPEETHTLSGFAILVSLGRQILRAETAAMLAAGLMRSFRDIGIDESRS